MLSISVVITTYKREIKLLKEAIDSVKMQTILPVEIIVVDDNGIGTHYQKMNQTLLENDDLIRYIPNEKNSGAQVSRNIGITAAKGELIAFLDDDDFWEVCKLEEQMKVFTDDRVGMSFSQGWVFNDGDIEHKKTYSSSAKFVKEPSFKLLLEKDVIGTTSQAVIRKGCFEKVGLFDIDMPARQDYEMWLRIAKRYRIIGVEKKLFYHRMHKSEQISKNSRKALSGYELILKKYKEDYDQFPQAKSYKYYKMGQTCLKSEHRIEGIKYYTKAFITAPLYIINNMIKRAHKG